jgi:putative chitinase
MTDLLPAAVLDKLWPNGDQHVPGLCAGIIAAAPTVFQKYGLTSSLLVAHAMAQFSEECGAGLEMVENDNFTAEQLVRLWPSHFTGSMAERLAHNPRMICDVAYGGRMGNAPPPSDDGYNYHGNGLSQVTGKDGYEALQAELKKQGCDLDIMSNPALVSQPQNALLCGVADFVLCGCLPYAEKDDVVGVTRKLNGGINGLAVREQWLAKWKPALAAAANEPSPMPIASSIISSPKPPPVSDDILADLLRDFIARINTRLTKAA